MPTLGNPTGTIEILKKYNLFQNDTPYISFVPIVDNTENTLKTLDILMEE